MTRNTPFTIRLLFAESFAQDVADVIANRIPDLLTVLLHNLPTDFVTGAKSDPAVGAEDTVVTVRLRAEEFDLKVAAAFRAAGLYLDGHEDSLLAEQQNDTMVQRERRVER